MSATKKNRDQYRFKRYRHADGGSFQRTYSSNAELPNFSQATACAAKVYFLSPGEARDAARRFGSRHDKAFKPYRCPVCNRWHLTTRAVEDAE